MNRLEASDALDKISNELKPIRVSYRNLKNELSILSDSQIELGCKQILRKLNKIDTEELLGIVTILSQFNLYKDMAEDADNMYKEIREMKVFLYSLEGEDSSDENEPLNKKINLIKDKYTTLMKQLNNDDAETLIKDAKIIESMISKLNLEDLPEGDYDLMVDMKNDVVKLIKTLIGVEKSEKYGPYIRAPFISLYSDTFSPGKFKKEEKNIRDVIDFIESPENIDMFETSIKRLISRKMTIQEFKKFFQSIISMKKSYDKRQFESYENYMIQEYLND